MCSYAGSVATTSTIGIGANGGTSNGMDYFELDDTLDLNTLNNIASFNDLIQGYNKPGNGKIISFYKMFILPHILWIFTDFTKKETF